MSDGYRYTNDEKLLLGAVFSYNHYPDRATVQDLADKLAVSEKKVYNWFTRKRSNTKLEVTHSSSLQCKDLS